MTDGAVATSDRLILRTWRAGDREPFRAMCNDARVMEFLGPFSTLDEVDAIIARLDDMMARLGYGFWAVERKEDGALLGFCGLKSGPAGTPLEGGIEIGWRLAHDYWGQGYAREAAQASLDWGWANLDVPLISAMTVPGNIRSWRLMERLGMRRVPGEFLHPDAPPGLNPHITYRIHRPASPAG